MDKHTIIFIGNPGVGKSTLLNSIMGVAHFKSGTSFGSGLTTVLQLVFHNGVHYGDTPGLEDVETKERAAKEIKRSLSQGGYYRIVFVVKDDSGRVRAQDATTLKLVLDALPKDVPFAVVVNDLSPKVCTTFVTGSRDFAAGTEDTDEAKNTAKFLTCLMSAAGRATREVFFYPRMKNLEGQENVVVDPATGFIEFINKMQAKVVIAEDVKEIDTANIDAVRKAGEDRISALNADNEKLNAEREELKKSLLEISNKPNPAPQIIHHHHGGGGGGGFFGNCVLM
eukprot:GHVU01047772.1.p1 GENE.GHVU01047772.1~~GHVU01047772.1.p1  ORF type:complete len:283 (+),score=46.76 GHVU01047772.1:1279-2127(+)